MGLEAYRLGVKFENNVSLDNVCSTMVEMGCFLLELNSNSAELELVSEKCILEFLVSKITTEPKERNNKEPNKILENIILQIRFSKVNPPVVVNELMCFLQLIDKKIKIKIVWDIEGKCSINLLNFDDLRVRFSKKQREFEKWFKFSYAPTRCKDVFKFF